MAGFNPFAPQMTQQQQRGKAPQIQGLPTPNVAMQSKPGLMETIGPAVAEKAIGSDMAKSAGNYLVDSGKDAWSALTKSPASPSTIPVSELSNTMGTAVSPSGMFGGAEGAMAAQQAAAANTAAQGTTALMGASPAAFGGMAAGGAEAAIAAEVAAAAAAEAAAASALTGAAAGTGAAAAAPMALAAGPFAPLVLGGMMLAANSGK